MFNTTKAYSAYEMSRLWPETVHSHQDPYWTDKVFYHSDGRLFMVGNGTHVHYWDRFSRTWSIIPTVHRARTEAEIAEDDQ